MLLNATLGCLSVTYCIFLIFSDLHRKLLESIPRNGNSFSIYNFLRTFIRCKCSCTLKRMFLFKEKTHCLKATLQYRYQIPQQSRPGLFCQHLLPVCATNPRNCSEDFRVSQNGFFLSHQCYITAPVQAEGIYNAA